MEIVEKDYLYHHGVKGMKWGVIRTAAQLGHYAKSAVKTMTEKAKASAERNKNSNKLTDEELRAKINRLSMEKQYRQLQAELNPKKEHKVLKFVGGILGSGVKTIANKAFQTLADNMFDKENKPSSVDLGSLSSVGDKTLAKAIKRASSEQTYKDLMKKRYEPYGKAFVEKYIKNAPLALPAPK